MNAPAVYADVPYGDQPHFQTQPDLLATAAALRGLSPARPGGARVLELGCNAGGNLIGLAYAHPGMTVMGIDYAPTAIAVARSTVERLGLPNARFETADIRDVADGRLGAFDYVVSHGIYAWVPAEVRDALLAATRAHLAPGGLGYVSYNAQPGGQLRRVLREAALWHGRAATTRAEQAAAARELFELLREVRAGETADDWYGAGLDTELRYLAGASDALLVHDLLADAWEPAWLAEFAAHAARHGLAYVGAARRDDDPAGASGEAEELLRRFSGGDPVRHAAYRDLVTFRRFRESVVCREEDAGALRAEPDPAVLAGLTYTAAPKRLAGDEPPAVAAVAGALEAAWPQGRAAAALGAAAGIGADALPGVLLDAFTRGLVDPHVDLPAVAVPGERPRASALARLQAAGDGEVTTLYNGIVYLDDALGRVLLTLLDGTRDRAALHRDFVAATGAEVSFAVLERNLASLGRLPLFHA